MTTETIQVAIIETDVLGALAYHAHCLTCDTRVCPTAHEKDTTAIKHAEAHRCQPEAGE